MIRDSSLESLKARIDIVDIVSNSVELKKAGANFKANCPFHNEKSGSFVVSPAKQIYHCFGCGAGGDAIKFVQEYKKLTFQEACEDIASDLNFTLEYDNNNEKKEYSKIMEKINEFFIYNLHQVQAEQLEYLHERGVSDESIKLFELGLALESQPQIDLLTKEMFNMQDAIECGVMRKGEQGRIYAHLTNRISFPIRNHAGKLIGFGGRTINGHDAKYINSQETKLFDKSRNLYGYNLAKEHIYKKGTFVITEGYMDVIMMHQAGIKTAVATMGTALTQFHCNIIKKVKAKALLCFDGDTAGRNAAFKASKLLSVNEIYGGVIIFPQGKDPADLVKDGDNEKLMWIMKRPVQLIQFAIDFISGQYNLNVPQNKQEALREIEAFTTQLSPIIQDEYKPYISKLLGINEQHIRTVKQEQPSAQPQSYIDIAEMNIIASALENDSNLDLVLDMVDTDMFATHKAEFEMLKAGDAKLQGMVLMDELSIYSCSELAKELKKMIIKHNEKEIEKIFASDMDFERKSFEIKKLKGVIYDLKKDLRKVS